jgi:hypothetical protein
LLFSANLPQNQLFLSSDWQEFPECVPACKHKLQERVGLAYDEKAPAKLVIVFFPAWFNADTLW